MNAERQLQTLSVFVHGALAALHVLGIAYNARRGNRFDTLAHTAAALYDAYAVGVHLNELEHLADGR